MPINQGHELCHQMAAGHTFRIPSSNEDVTPDKLASGTDRLTLDLNASSETWHGVIQGWARDVWVRACCSHEPYLTCSAFGLHSVDTLHKLRRRLAMLQHHPLIAAWR